MVASFANEIPGEKATWELHYTTAWELQIQEAAPYKISSLLTSIQQTIQLK